jgi:hypothetical protein
MAPSAFHIFDAFSATKKRSGDLNTESWRDRNEIVSHFNFKITQALTHPCRLEVLLP